LAETVSFRYNFGEKAGRKPAVVAFQHIVPRFDTAAARGGKPRTPPALVPTSNPIPRLFRLFFAIENVILLISGRISSFLSSIIHPTLRESRIEVSPFWATYK
jgi:hypothetical protein